MPELPEVETIVRGLRRCLPGRRITGVALTQPRVLRTPAIAIEAAVTGARIQSVERRGKFILLRLRKHEPFWLVIHLGMTGQLICEPAANPHPPHTHALFEMDNGTVLRYTDIRQFGRLELAAARLVKLGPDPLEISEAEFVQRLRTRAARVKALLLDQHFLAGLGNIYADEALFRAGVRPAAIGRRLSRLRAARLWRAVREVLEEAIAHGGSSISDYLDSEGRAGAFQERHRVYGRADEPCLNCASRLRRTIVAGRGTTYCPRCQV